jgi:hypothetical protein
LSQTTSSPGSSGSEPSSHTLLRRPDLKHSCYGPGLAAKLVVRSSCHDGPFSCEPSYHGISGSAVRDGRAPGSELLRLQLIGATPGLTHELACAAEAIEPAVRTARTSRQL